MTKITTSNIITMFELNPDCEFDLDILKTINWEFLSICEFLSESFISKFYIYLNWDNICKYQKLSSRFIEKYQNFVNWHLICIYQKLSSKFIEKFSDKIHWYIISKFQKLSQNFIIKNIEKLNLSQIRKYQFLSKKFRRRYKKILGFMDDMENHPFISLYWNNDRKKELFKNSPFIILNDEYGEYIIAYKAVTKDNYSIFNKQYLYKKYKTYTSHCDCNLLQLNSFGLSAWTKDLAKTHAIQIFGCSSNFKIIKLKIYIADVGAVLSDNNWKIRARKIEVI